MDFEGRRLQSQLPWCIASGYSDTCRTAFDNMTRARSKRPCNRRSARLLISGAYGGKTSQGSMNAMYDGYDFALVHPGAFQSNRLKLVIGGRFGPANKRATRFVSLTSFGRYEYIGIGRKVFRDSIVKELPPSDLVLIETSTSIRINSKRQIVQFLLRWIGAQLAFAIRQSEQNRSFSVLILKLSTTGKILLASINLSAQVCLKVLMELHCRIIKLGKILHQKGFFLRHGCFHVFTSS